MRTTRTMLVHRRQLLRGAGGFTLGLPLLPSLFPRSASAVEYALAPQPRFVAMATDHGGISEQNMYPKPTLEEREIFAGHKARVGTLKLASAGGRATLSPVLTGSAGVFTDKLVAKMNVLRGFDVPYYIGHHTGAHLGNYVRSDQGPKNMASFVTVDQVMAYSSSFYPSMNGVRQRAVVTGQDFAGISFTYSNPSAKTGVQKSSIEQNPGALFDKLIGGATSPTAQPRSPIVDRVLKAYKSLRESSRRLSAEDRRRLDDHIARLSELEQSLKVTPRASCGGTKPTIGELTTESPAPSATYYNKLNDVLAAAFACGSTRIAVMHVRSHFYDYGGSWHQEVAHQGDSPDKQAILMTGLQRTFEATFLDLASKLDSIEEAPGKTALDNTLMQWTQESGVSTHEGQGMGIVTAGSAGGFLKTGLYVDYRNVSVPTYKMSIFGRYDTHTLGLGQRHWLATVLLAMGVPKTEWEKDGKPGYGDAFAHDSYLKTVRPEVISNASDVVPLLKA